MRITGKRSDADVFMELCAPYEDMVYRHCLQLLKNTADAEDAAQEAMLRAYRSIGSFKRDCGPATWLYRIAHNVCLDHLKRPRVKRESVSLDAMAEGGYDPADPSATPDAAYAAEAENERVREAMRQLPDDMQALLTLRYGENMPYEQLATALSLNTGTVKSKLSRAKDRLRELLQKDRD